MKFGSLHLQLYIFCPCISGSGASEQSNASPVKTISTLYLLELYPKRYMAETPDRFKV